MRNLLILAKWLANRAGIDVCTYRASTARIGKRGNRLLLLLPESWCYTDDPSVIGLLEGVVDHEALGHGRHTDFDEYSKAILESPSESRKLFKAVLNILEDVYIERSAIRTYPGVKKNLARTVEILHGRGFFGFPHEFYDAKPAQLITAGLLNVLRYRFIEGQTILSENAWVTDRLLKTVIGDTWTEILDVACLVENSKATIENIDLANQIVAILKAKAEEPESPSPSQDQSDQDETGDGQPDETVSDQAGQSPNPDQADEASPDAGDVQPGDPAQDQAGKADQDASQDQSAENQSGEAAPGQAGQSPNPDQTDEAGEDAGNGPPGEPTQDQAGQSGQDASQDQFAAGQPDESASDQTDEANPGPGDGQSGEPTQGQAGEAGQDASQDQSAESQPGDGSGTGQDSSPSCPVDQDGPDDSQDQTAAREFAREVMADEDIPETEITEFASQVISALSHAAGQHVMTETACKTDFTADALNVASRIKAAASQLEEALIAETFDKTQTKLSGRRLNNRVLYRPRVGSSRIFSKRSSGEGLSIAVSIMLDLSGSTDELLADGIARRHAEIGLTIGLGNLLDEFDVPFEVYCFSDRFACAKSFDQDWNSVVKSRKFPHMTGWTYTGAAMTRALSSLVCRGEERRLMLNLTDGGANDFDLLVSCYGEAQAMGVEIASVMIGPVIPQIQELADRFGFKARSINESSGLGKFAADRILESI